jgi:hypothetical protein
MNESSVTWNVKDFFSAGVAWSQVLSTILCIGNYLSMFLMLVYTEEMSKYIINLLFHFLRVPEISNCSFFSCINSAQ